MLGQLHERMFRRKHDPTALLSPIRGGLDHGQEVEIVASDSLGDCGQGFFGGTGLEPRALGSNQTHLQATLKSVRCIGRIVTKGSLWLG
jgi:hypothetical protein